MRPCIPQNPTPMTPLLSIHAHNPQRFSIVSSLFALFSIEETLSLLTPGRPDQHRMLFPAGPSRRQITLQRYGITPETDAEAAAAMLRLNDDVVGCSTLPGQPAVTAGAQVPQVRPTQTQASTSRPQEIGVSCCGFVFVFSCRRRSNSHQP
jgi:hypothetical protein